MVKQPDQLEHTVTAHRCGRVVLAVGRKFGATAYNGLIATLRHLITPSPCCSVNGPSANRPL